MRAVTKRNEEINTLKFGRYLDVFIYFIVLFYIIKLTSNSPLNYTYLVMFLFNLFMPNDLPFLIKPFNFALAFNIPVLIRPFQNKESHKKYRLLFLTD